MTGSKFLNWLHLIVNFGIIICLIIIISKIDRNDELNRVGALSRYIDSYAKFEAYFAGENLPILWEKSVTEPENLTIGEMRALEAVTLVTVNRWIDLFRQSEAGILKPDDWRIIVRNDLLYYLGSPYGRAWWQNFGQAMYGSRYIPTDVYKLIENGLKLDDKNSMQNRYETIRESIRESKIEPQFLLEE